MSENEKTTVTPMSKANLVKTAFGKGPGGYDTAGEFRADWVKLSDEEKLQLAQWASEETGIPLKTD